MNEAVPKTPRQIIAEHIADFAVDEPTTETWKQYTRAAGCVRDDLAAAGWEIVRREAVNQVERGRLPDIHVNMAPATDQERLDLMEALVKHFGSRPGALSLINSGYVGTRSWQTICSIRDEYKARVRSAEKVRR